MRADTWRGRDRVQLLIDDVAEAAVRALEDPGKHGGKIYELGGPRVYTYKALLQLVLNEAGKRRVLVPVPFFIWDILAAFLAFLPSPPLTRDQVKLMKGDNVVDGNALTLEDLGIVPASVEEILPTYINASLGSSMC